MSKGVNNLHEFGSFRLDAETGTLWRNNDIVSLSPKAAELLKLLTGRHGQVVSKQEIFDTVWAGTFVEDGVLTQNIYTLRNALGLDEHGKQFIETVPRRGYRFAGVLKRSGLEVESAKQGPDSGGATPAPDSMPIRPLMAGLPIVSRYPLLRLLLFTGAIVLSLGVVWFGVYKLYRPGENGGLSKPAPIEQVRLRRLTDTGDVLFPAISPDGELLAFVRIGEQEASVWVKQIATGSSVQTLPLSRKGYRSLAFSSDGRYLFFREEAEGGPIFQVPVLGGTPKKVAENAWTDFGISPDGKQLAFVRRDTGRDADLLILSNTDGSGDRELSSRQSPNNYLSAPSWSPGGEKLAIGAGLSQEFPIKILTIDVANGRETELKTPKWRSVAGLLWMPNGKNLIVSAREINESSSQLWMLDYPDGDVRRLTNDLESYLWISRTVDGQILITRQQRIVAHLWLLPGGDIKKAQQLTYGERNFDGYVGLAWTPSGKIIFSVRSGQVTDLYSMDADGGNQAQLTSNAGTDNTYPAVTGDGGRVVFTSNRTGTTQIWQMDTDGRDQRQLTFGDEQKERAQWPVISPDGSEIFYVKRGDGPATIWKVSLDGGSPTQISHIAGGSVDGPLSVSPDGKLIAYRHVPEKPEAGGVDRTLRIGVIPLAEGDEEKFFDLPMRRPILQWTANGSFDYAAGTFNTSSIVHQPLAGGEGQKFIDFPDRVFNFAWSRDGKNLIVSRGSLRGDALLINLPNK